MKYIYIVIAMISSLTFLANPNRNLNSVNGFIENKGQIVDMNGDLVPHVLFKIQANNIDCYVTKTGVTYLFKKLISDSSNSEEKHEFIWERVDLDLKNATINSLNVLKENESKQGVLNYYLAHCSKGVRNVREHGKITIKDIYPNIDWVLYNSSDKGFKYDFILHKGAVVSDIKLTYKSKEEAVLLKNGELKINTMFGELTEKAPISYYNNKLIKSKFILQSTKLEKSRSFENNISFEFESIIPKVIEDKELIIDPVLEWSSFYGGNHNDDLRSIETDSEGNAIYVGITSSSDFPVLDGGGFYQSTGGYQGQSSTTLDCFIIKFNNNGVRLWATYYGGERTEIAYDVAIDKNDNIFFVGRTQSENFPTFDAGTYFLPYYPSNNGIHWEDCFIVKLSSSSDLLWATCFGGSNDDRPYAVTIDLNDNVYVGGRTKSGDFLFKQKVGAYNQLTTCAITNTDGFIVQFSNQGDYLWGTPVGGTYSNSVGDLDTDSYGNLFVLGRTRSINFPLVDNSTYFQPNIGGNNSSYNENDLTIMKFNVMGELKWSTYYGGAQNEGGNSESIGSLVVDLNNNIYVLGFGRVDSSFPFYDAGGFFENSPPIFNNSILLKFNNEGERLWATAFHQGTYPTGYNYGTGDHMKSRNKLAIDKCSNHLYALLHAFNSDRSTVPISSASFQQDYAGNLDQFFVEFDENTNLVYSSYLGGSGQDADGCISTDNNGGIWLGSRLRKNLSSYSLSPSIMTSYPITQGVGYSQSITQSAMNASEMFFTKFSSENEMEIGTVVKAPIYFCDSINYNNHWYFSSENLLLTIHNQYGCDSIIEQVSLTQNCNEDRIDNLYIPNVFTPNGDKNNDVFEITIDNKIVSENGELTIYNRWGNKILYTNKEMRWNGVSNPSGVYYYIFKFNDSIFKGNISLFRE